MKHYFVLLALFACATHAGYSSLISDNDIDLTGMWLASIEYKDADIWKDAERVKVIQNFKAINQFKGVVDLIKADKPNEKLAEIDYAWFVKRVFIPRTASGKMAAVNIGKTTWRYDAWFNETKLGQHSGGFSPAVFTVAKNAIRFGDTNTITLKIGGWPALPFSTVKKLPLQMRGAPWAKAGPSITDGVWLEFFDEIRIKEVKVETAIKPPVAVVKIWLDNAADIDARVTIKAAITKWKEALPVSRVEQVSLDQEQSRTTPTSAPIVLKFPCPKVTFWSPANPALYEVVMTLSNDNRFCQQKRFRFGFRTFTVSKGRFYLNDEPLVLRGSDLYNQCVWFGDKARDRSFIKQMLITDMRSLNCTVFRTHTTPFTDDWNDVCDEEGALLFCEFPITVNFGDWRFTPEERNTFHANALREIEQMLPHYWNRPSIVTWVMTNESHEDEAWENNELSEFFRNMDATRPINRSCFQTPDMADIHDYSGTWYGTGGDFREKMTVFANTWGASGKPIINSEYLGFRNEIAQRIVLSRATSTYGEFETMIARDLSARIAMEETEWLRILGFDGIFPYAAIASGFQPDYKQGEFSPEQKACRNALAPVMVSVNTLDPHVTCGSKVKLIVSVSNDLSKSLPVKITCGLTQESPEYDFSPLLKQSIVKPHVLTGIVPAQGSKDLSMTFEIPETPGRYYFLALLESAQGANMSHRLFMAFKKPECPDEIIEKRIAVIESGKEVATLLRALGCKNILHPDSLPVAGMAVIGWDIPADEDMMKHESRLKKFAEAGGKILVLEQRNWPFTNLAPISIERMGGRSGVEMLFIKDARHPFWQGIDTDRFWRMNGQRQSVFQFAVKNLPDSSEIYAEGKESYTDKNFQIAVAEVKLGKGSMVFNQLKLRGRIEEKSPDFDPAALTIFYNMLQSRQE
ncbi:MAG: hypothetical protein A2268_03795 [Candidatus Raymondbacteria bacterium RifOxyA12_full_50_37]|uniref:Glycoside hydrolase family 2 catalytic domain-containing protein n=1 Tax=Candidatus Raymondbacteria bacterium RIFOXYD12_FULL_49_13 TaxID=1817890 RepID=A0A1F7F4X9_UNCRA|nr:MAG: hypothetical protein A2350_03565 [Candidatus Raymondbacteria bacterium RifOxyB12_full_50_8]OGJ90566.1 MAG: hypothetical protein A2268_03795 [Candidatus Raymondbacteria bacterium RifOxyA12_full_50_37]OGJ91915.1 MAG: hypothetical protein A2248_04865 [Candidatus Raymondbacteria bacterium RIFOXYA2_FULL_49_16]OGJ98047.1 MAG: hypothetical protein A2453_12155 [Candidatus Raymondbacteria bacterium RIFOXYC2_FULL_50_21]OGK01638.1 MAG: hypothetical protein A2519_08875 [Candidatus Raymondbacteria b